MAPLPISLIGAMLGLAIIYLLAADMLKLILMRLKKNMSTKRDDFIMTKLLLTAFLIPIFIIPASVYAEESRPASVPEYSLSVSFDIEASKIFGKAQIHALA